jgi:hypothetical protein
MPGNYAGTNLDVQFVWTASAGTVGNTIVWGIEGYPLRDANSTSGTSLNFPVQIMRDSGADAYQGILITHITTLSNLAVIYNSPAAGDIVQIKVCKEATSTLATTAQLLMVILKYNTNKLSD